MENHLHEVDVQHVGQMVKKNMFNFKKPRKHHELVPNMLDPMCISLCRLDSERYRAFETCFNN